MIKQFTANYVRISKPPHLIEDYILLQDVRYEDGSIFREHTWIKYSAKRWSKIKRGKVSFTAKVCKYPLSQMNLHKFGLYQVRRVCNTESVQNSA